MFKLLLVLGCLFVGAEAQEALKLGALLGDSSTNGLGQRALELWASWANSEDNMVGFTVTMDVRPYNADTLAADIQALIDDGANVLIPPYGSGGTIAFVNAVPEGSTIPIMVWGGASDSIYSDACMNKNCFGTFTKGSQYMIPGLNALLSKASAPSTVAIIQNDNAFSMSVCDGADAYADATYGLMVGQQLSVPQGALSEDDKAAVAAVADSMPDIIVVCGHSGGDVEDIISELASSGMVPKAILATNSITSGAISRFAELGHEIIAPGLLMPTQWGMAADMVDPNVGWTTDMFISAFGADASYHAASAAAAGLVLTEALAMDGATADTVGNFIGSVNIDTFYGHISFNADGSPMKPMYVQQYQGDESPVFASMYGEMRYPLESMPGWGRVFTCGVVKEYYRDHMCCGMPDKELDAYMASHELFTSEATNMPPMDM